MKTCDSRTSRRNALVHSTSHLIVLVTIVFAAAVQAASREMVYVGRSMVLGPTVILNGGSQAVAGTAPVLGAASIALTPDGTRAYVGRCAPYGYGCRMGIDVLDLPTNNVIGSIAGLTTPKIILPSRVAITPDGSRVYATDSASYPQKYSYGYVTVVDTTTNTIIKTIQVYGWHQAIAITPDGGYVYVLTTTLSGSSTIHIIDTTTDTRLSRSINMGQYCTGSGSDIAFTPNGAYAYVVCGYSYVKLIDTASMTLVGNIYTGGLWHQGVAITPDGSRAYVSNGNSDTVSVLDLSTNGVIATIGVAPFPRAVAVSKDGTRVYVAGAYVISVIDSSTNTVLTTIENLASWPNGLSMLGTAVVDYVPSARAASDQSVNAGSLVTLDGSGSFDLGGDSLSFHWTQVAGSSVALILSNPVRPTFVAPVVSSEGATITFGLTVSDGQLVSEPTVVNVTVKFVNFAPVADAGESLAVSEQSVVTLDGSRSYDPNGDALTYSWTQMGGSSVALSDPSAVAPVFTAPSVGSQGEALTFQLTVSDGLLNSTSTVSILVENVNHPPVANAGGNQTRNEGSFIGLDGSGSSDPDGDQLGYQWSQVSGPPVLLQDANSPIAEFEAPLVGPGGETLAFQLVVSDGILYSEPAFTRVSILNVNDPPNCSLAQVNPSRLWPPDHKLLPIQITGVTDPNDEVTISVLAITQDEPINGLGDGDTGPDAMVIGGQKLLLRAERSGSANGRAYQVNFRADDRQGGTCTGSVRITVPVNLKPGTSVIDDGQVYDSTRQ